MNEEWKKQIQQDQNENNEKPQYKTLSEGKNVFIIDLSTRQKVVRDVNDGIKMIKKTYVMFDLIGDEVPKISLTTYQYSQLLKSVGNIESLTKVVEVIADVNVINKKKEYSFVVNNEE